MSGADAWKYIDKIYVLGHMKYEPHRVNRVLSQLSLHGAPNEKVKITAPTWGRELTSEDCFKVYDPWLPREFPCFVFKSRALLKGEISLVLNFHAAIMDAVKEGHQQILVLESDVLFRHDFTERFQKIMETVQGTEWGYISLSDGVGTHAKNILFGEWYKEQSVEPAGSSFPFRCTDSMVFHRRFFEPLTKTLIPFRDCLDWELNYQHYLHRAIVLWAEPHIIEQGSIKRLDPSILAKE